MAIHADTGKSVGQIDGPRALREKEYPSALGLINSALRPQGPSTILDEYPLVLGNANLDNMRVIVKDGEVVSHAAIYYSNLRTGDLAFKMGAIGSVATHPEHRGRGLASLVMRDCLDIMQASGCHLSVLWTQVPDFYRTLEYETAGSEYLFRAKISDFAHVAHDCKVVPYSPRYLSDIIKIHRREVFRTERTEREYEAYFGIPRTRILLAVRGDSVSAYAVMGKGEDMRHCIHEWGGDAKDLIRLARDLALSSGKKDFLILAPAQECGFSRLLEQMRIPKVLEYLAMLRIIDLDGLSSILSDYLGSRLDRGFEIVSDESGLKMRVGDEEVAIDSHQTLVRVLFGPDPPSNPLRGFLPETASMLDRILPIPLFIWGLDSV